MMSNRPMLKNAVCLFLSHLQDDKLLAVSRRGDTSRWGMPGGKVDAGEHSLQALLREVREEIGLTVPPEELVPLYSAVCYGQDREDSYWVTTYAWLPSSLPSDAAITAEDGLSVSWLSEAQLCDPNISPFSDYNVSAFAAWRQLMA